MACDGLLETAEFAVSVAYRIGQRCNSPIPVGNSVQLHVDSLVSIGDCLIEVRDLAVLPSDCLIAFPHGFVQRRNAVFTVGDHLVGLCDRAFKSNHIGLEPTIFWSDTEARCQRMGEYLRGLREYVVDRIEISGIGI